MTTSPSIAVDSTVSQTEYPEPDVIHFNEKYLEVRLGHISTLAARTPAAVAAAIVDLQSRYEMEATQL